MKILSEGETYPKGSFVATIGFFDGVHIGHRYLLNKLNIEAKQRGKKSLVISFVEHPKTVLSKTHIPLLLSTNEEKIKLIEECGIDYCIFLHFSMEMANLSAKAFLENIIVNQLGVDTLIIGYDHRFGHDRLEGFKDYVHYGKELGLKVIHADSYNGGICNISSSMIRKLLLGGKIEEANKMLSSPYKIKGRVINGEKIGRTIGYPTANIKICNNLKLVPENGVYAVAVNLDGIYYKGMLNIGKRPTVSMTGKESIEVFLLDFKCGDIYDKEIEVRFFRRLRSEEKFKDIQSLKEQLKKDEEEVRGMEFNFSFC